MLVFICSNVVGSYHPDPQRSNPGSPGRSIYPLYELEPEPQALQRTWLWLHPFLNVPHFPNYFLPKTFSKTDFQGQYPMKAVSSNKTPTTIEAGLQKLLNEKPQRIRIIPRIIRITLSTLATFLLIAIIFSCLSLHKLEPMAIPRLAIRRKNFHHLTFHGLKVYRLILTLWITTGSNGLSTLSVSVAPIFFTTSIPLMTVPKTECRSSR